MIGLPLGLVSAFHFKMGLVGLWMGLTGGLCFVSLASLAIVIRTNWHKEASRAAELCASNDPYLRLN